MLVCDKPKIKITPATKAQSYIDDVMSGHIVVCKYVRQAVERHVKDLQAGHLRGLSFDVKAASTALRFVELLRHSQGEWAGSPLTLEPWQAFILWCVFGWKKANGTRRYNTAFVSVARKNGKTTVGAAVGLKLFMADGEQGAQVYSCATKRDQAKICHEEAKRMVKKCPALAKQIQILRDNLYCHNTESKYEPLASDTDSLDGLNISGAIVDELHAHRNRSLWDVIETGTGSRRNPLLFAITTAGSVSDSESIYAELKSYTIKVLSGEIQDDSWYGIIYTLDESDDWTDSANWIKSNPNLGVSVKLDDLERKFLKAMETPSAQSNFRRKHLNEETESDTPWIATDANSLWARCGDKKIYWNGISKETIEMYRGRDCWVGCDLSSVCDLTAMVYAFNNPDKSIDIVCQCWCPRTNAIGRAKDARIPYLSWAEQGYLYLTEGDSVDYDCLRSCLKTARDEWGWRIKQLIFDPNGARYLETVLKEQDGFFHDNQIVEHFQTTNFMNDPINVTEKLILDKRLNHGNHPVLRWCVSNSIIYADTGGRRRFDKKNRKDKIDLAVAMVMSVGSAASQVGVSVYDNRGLRHV